METQIIKLEDGTEIWLTQDAIEFRVDGDLHRENGPALIDNDGTLMWFNRGKRTKIEHFETNMETANYMESKDTNLINEMLVRAFARFGKEFEDYNFIDNGDGLLIIIYANGEENIFFEAY